MFFRVSAPFFFFDLFFVLSVFSGHSGGQAAGLLATAAVLSSTSPLLAALLLPLGWIYARLQRYYRSSSRELRRLDSTSRCAFVPLFLTPTKPTVIDPQAEKLWVVGTVFFCHVGRRAGLLFTNPSFESFIVPLTSLTRIMAYVLYFVFQSHVGGIVMPRSDDVRTRFRGNLLHAHALGCIIPAVFCRVALGAVFHRPLSSSLASPFSCPADPLIANVSVEPARVDQIGHVPTDHCRQNRRSIHRACNSFFP